MITTCQGEMNVGGGGMNAGACGNGGGQPAGCFLGGNDAGVAAADGKCGDPIIIDITGVAVGCVVYQTVTSAQHGDSTFRWGYGDCVNMTFSNTANDYVFQVNVDVGVTRLDVSVDGTGGSADLIVAIIEDASCGQLLNACSDVNGVGDCEWVGGTQADVVWLGTGLYVLVSEEASSGEDVTVRFRIDGSP